MNDMGLIERKFTHWANYYVGIAVLAAISVGVLMALRYIYR